MMVAANDRNDEPEDSPDQNLLGGVGGVFGEPMATDPTMPKHLRSEARLVAKLLSCGVIPEKQARELIALGGMLAKASALRGNTRDYAAAMKILVAGAKLELQTAQYTDPKATEVHHTGFIGLALGELRQELMHDDRILEADCKRAIEEDAQSRPVRADGESRPMEDGTTPSDLDAEAGADN